MAVIPDPTVIRKYMTLQGAWFAANGLQMVLFPYLVADRLHMTASLVGIAQAVMMLPTFLLMLPGGSLADRFDSRSILIAVHSLAAVPPLLLGLAVAAGLLSYPALLAYGFAMGTLGAFSQPARDSLLSRVVQAGGGGMPLQRAVALASMVMFSTQIVGMVLASQADKIGVAPLLWLQAAGLLATILVIRQLRLPSRPKIEHGKGLAYQIEQMREGLVEAFGHTKIMPVIIVAFCIGIFYMGAFQVILPIQIREFHGGGAMRFALMSICFFGGTIVSTVALFRRGGVKRAGLAVMIAVSGGVMVLATLSIHLPYWGLLLAVFVWGLFAGVTITLARTVVQEFAPESHRGRLLAIFSMGFMGGGPIGSFGMGYLINYMGPFTSALIPAVMMAVALIALALTTSLLRVELPTHNPAATA